ncbi:hypothetical protein L596_015439 [Steinernema carpocapsae]|uniref:Fibronectin type-III domain-containing protein n=1 Tax=Steinernema carpocapsae TaxID=34508 RepID=A0A4U5NFZ8_STECR|nr:hypothetical protein L596_015439 [Steinernema carpocapsae]
MDPRVDSISPARLYLRMCFEATSSLALPQDPKSDLYDSHCCLEVREVLIGYPLFRVGIPKMSSGLAREMFVARLLAALIAMCLASEALGAFTIQPFKQLDYDHYVRLAQCMAKCTEMYGKHSRLRLNDGTSKIVFATAGVDEYKYCERGCQNRRLVFKKHNARSLAESLEHGEKFWNESEGVQRSTNSSVISAVEPLCQNVAPTSEEGYGNGIETLIAVKTETKLDEQKPVKFLVQWKHKVTKRGFTNENQWITASIESENLIRVDGLIPGVAYKFRVTAIGPKGKLGKVVESEWLKALPSVEEAAKSGGPMTLRPQYNSEDGVSNLISWPAAVGSCHYRVQWSNATSSLHKQFILDETRSFLLDHLYFGTEYLVKLTALSSEDSSLVSDEATVETRFTSIGCNEVFGRGSLECPPEPVTDLSIVVGKNGTARVTWTPSADPSVVLAYQVMYKPLESSSHECNGNSLDTYLQATSTSASIFVNPKIACDYELSVFNYDVGGHDAVASIPFSVRPNPKNSPSGFHLPSHNAKLNPIALLALPGVVVVVLFACCIYAIRLRCVHGEKKRGSLMTTDVSGPSLV